METETPDGGPDAAHAFYELLGDTLKRHDETLARIDGNVTGLSTKVENLRVVVNDQMHTMQATLDAKADMQDVTAFVNETTANLARKDQLFSVVAGRFVHSGWTKFVAVSGALASFALLIHYAFTLFP